MSAPGGEAVAARVLALADEELALVHAGDAERLAELRERRDAAMAQLPADLSPTAVELLQRALARQREVEEALRHAMGVVRGELGLTARGRRLARGYAPALGGSRRTLDRTA